MNTTQRGREAEEIVSKYLQTNGHSIIAMNWRTRWCEIDIVSRKKRCVYFTEVKFRNSSQWGSGFDYIHQQKQKQMLFAAEYWMHQNDWSGDAQLLGAEVSAELTVEIVAL